MDKKKSLDYLLFNNSDNLNKDSFANYIYPNYNSENTLDMNLLNSQNISDTSIKNKILKVVSSMKSFNIILKPNNNLHLDYNLINSNLIDNFLSSVNNKNHLISFLLDFIIDFMWKVKEESIQKDSLNCKINNLKSCNEDLERKIKKISNEIEEKNKEIKIIYNKSEMHKENFEKSSKNQNFEFNEIKNENKKLNNMIIFLKAEAKKKENDFNKLQEKLKRNITNLKTQNMSIDYTLNDTKYKSDSNNLIILSKTMLEASESKLDLITNQNTCLLDLLKKLNLYIEQFVSKCNNISNNTIGNLYKHELINIKENIFSIHLLENNLLEDFYSNFVNNLNIFDKIIQKLLDTNGLNLQFLKGNDKSNLNNFIKNPTVKISTSPPNNRKKDLLKNIKKWNVNTIKKEEDSSKHKKLQSMSSKWFDSIDKAKEIYYEYNESNVIKDYNID